MIGLMFSGIWEALNARLFAIGETPVSVATIATAAVLVAATFGVSRLLQRAVHRGFRRRGVQQEGTARAVSRLVHYAVLAVGVGSALQTVGVDLGAMFAAGAIFAVGIGFAMQSIAQNFVAGVILLMERSITPGDILRVEDTLVKVVDLGIRATIVMAPDGENIIVPNSVLIQSSVRNYTLSDSAFRVRIGVGVVYSSDLREVHEVLNAAAREVHAEWGSMSQEPVVFLTGFGASSVDFEVAVWMSDPWNVRVAVSELHDAVWWALKKRDIVIAFPQLDVHFDAKGTDGVAGGSPPRRAAS